MAKDLFFFLGILALFFVLWLSSGGPNKPISFSGPYLTPITSTSSTSRPYGDPDSYRAINSNVLLSAGGVNVSQGASARKGAVTLSRNTSGVSASDPEEEYLIITASLMGTEGVSTAGWKLVSAETGRGAPLPAGAVLPITGRVNTLASVVLQPGEDAIIVSGRSPVGLSFKENICIGYLEDRQDFSPPLPLSCPTPSQELARFYDVSDDDEYDECERFVRTIPYCSVDTDVPSEIPNSCESFIERALTYNGCVAGHQGDSDFTGRTWRIFLGAREELWKRDRETILLLDADNKVIDSLTY